VLRNKVNATKQKRKEEEEEEEEAKGSFQ